MNFLGAKNWGMSWVEAKKLAFFVSRGLASHASVGYIGCTQAQTEMHRRTEAGVGVDGPSHILNTSKGSRGLVRVKGGDWATYVMPDWVDRVASMP